MFQNKTHIFFDLDHTLWDFEKNSALAYQEIFSSIDVPFSLSDFLEIYVPTNFKYWKLFREEKISKEDLRYHRLNEVFEQLNYNTSKEQILFFADQYIDLLPTFKHLFDGAIELLDYLKEKYQLHIITNGFAEVQHNKLKTSGLLPYFETTTNSEMVGVKKPDPKIFEFALNQANASQKESVMIGDSLEADIFGAQSFGLDTIYFNVHQFDDNFKTTQVSHLLEIKQFF